MPDSNVGRTVNILIVLNTENALFSAQDELVQIQYLHCNRWWIYSPRSAVDGNKGDVDDANFDVPKTPLVPSSLLPADHCVAYADLQAGRCRHAHLAARDRCRHSRRKSHRRADLSSRPGTVQAFYTVTVTARVDGELQKIGFTEGQEVHKGDLLAQIDPRQTRPPTSRRWPPRRRMPRCWKMPSAMSIVTPCCSPRSWRASRPSIRRGRCSISSSQVQVDQALIDNARTQLDYTRITSPINGRTGIRLVDPGNIVHAAGTTGIVVVTQVQPITVIFTLPEEDLSAVGAALAAGPVKVTTLSRDGKTELDQGTLTLIDNEIDQPTGTAKLKATFSNTRNTLWPGQYVNARVLIRTERNALTLPTSAVQLGPNGPFTYVIRATPRWKSAPDAG